MLVGIVCVLIPMRAHIICYGPTLRGLAMRSKKKITDGKITLEGRRTGPSRMCGATLVVIMTMEKNLIQVVISQPQEAGDYTVFWSFVSLFRKRRKFISIDSQIH
jgi:hypothetical protein